MCDQVSNDPVTGPDRASAARDAATDHTSAAARQGVWPIRSAEDLIQPGMFDSDDELVEFLADLYASRRTDAW